MMRLYDYLWEKEVVRTFILGGSFAGLALLLDFILIIWDKDLREIELLSFLYAPLSLLETYIEPVLCLVHILLWAVFFFFFFAVYANIRDLLDTPSGYIDMAVIIGAITLISIWLSGTLNGLVVGTGFFLISLVESFYIQAAVKE